MEPRAKHKRTGQPALSRFLGTLLYWIAPPWPWRGWVDDVRRWLPPWESEEPEGNIREELLALFPDPPQKLPLHGGIAGLTAPWRPLTPEELAAGLPAARETLAAREPILTALRSWVGRPYAAGIAPSAEAVFSLPFGQLRETAWTVGAAAHIEHREGRDDEALRTLESAASLGASLACGGSWTVLLTAGIILREAGQGAAVVIREGHPSDEALHGHARLARELRARMAPLPRWILWEAICAEDIIGQMAWGQPLTLGAAGSPVTEEGLTRIPVETAQVTIGASLKRHYSIVWLRDRCARLIEEAAKPPAARDLAGAEERAKRDARARRDVVALGELPPATTLERLLATAETRLVGEEIVSALELHKRARGAYPESLDDLVPEQLPDVPTDPFTGGRMCYRREDAGYTLYSVGSDRVDDGGTYQAPGHDGPDLVLVGGRCLERDGEAG
jgi:hypothetical protein